MISAGSSLVQQTARDQPKRLDRRRFVDWDLHTTRILWWAVFLAPFAMTVLAVFSIAIKIWPLTAAPIAAAFALLSGWVLHLARTSQDQ
jgi:hypothetical protein